MANPYANYFKPQNPNKQYLPFYGKSQEDIAKMQQQGYGGYGYKTPTEMWQGAGSPGGSNWNFDPTKGPVGPRQQPKMPMPRIPVQRMGGKQMPQMPAAMPRQAMQQFPQQPMGGMPQQYGYQPAARTPQTQNVQYMMNQPQQAPSFGQRFAPVFANMMRMYEPKKPGANYYAEQEGKYKTYQPSFEKIGQFYSGLKNYAPSISQKSGKEFDQVFFDYASQLDPSALPENLMTNFFDWYTKTIAPYTFLGESQDIESQLGDIKRRQKEAEAEKQAIDDRARQLKEWAMSDEDRETRIRNEAQDRGIRFEDRLRQIAAEELAAKRAEEDRQRSIGYTEEDRRRAEEDRQRSIGYTEEDRRRAEEERQRSIGYTEEDRRRAEEERQAASAKAEEERRKAEEEQALYSGTEIPPDVEPFYNSIMALYQSNEYKPLNVRRASDGTYVIENQFVISQTGYNYLKKIGAVP